MRLESWRKGADWKNSNLSMSTGSDEACKLYDVSLTQYVGWYEDEQFGGLENSLSKMLAADPNFVMGHTLSTGLDLISSGYTVRKSKELKEKLDNLSSLVKKQSGDLSKREKKHVEAVLLWADGSINEAAEAWEDILLYHPNDMFALKMAHDSYFYMGYQEKMRNSVSKVIKQVKPSEPLYNYLFGMYAFGLVETNFHKKAEEMAKKGLSMNPKDGWATHALAHVYEMEKRIDDGISFISSTLSDWTTCQYLACHNFWHWALYHIEKGEYEAALDIFDNEIGKRIKSGAMLDIVDSTSLLYRLGLEGVSVGDRWKEVYEICKPHVDDHILVFNDVHVLMACLGANADEKSYFFQSYKDFLEQGKNLTHKVSQEVGYPLAEAFLAYDEKRYEDVVNLMYPIRYKIVQIGGSDAQRDLFNILLINSALQSKNSHHHCLARHLLHERAALAENSPLTERLMARALALHTE